MDYLDEMSIWKEQFEKRLSAKDLSDTEKQDVLEIVNAGCASLLDYINTQTDNPNLVDAVWSIFDKHIQKASISPELRKVVDLAVESAWEAVKDLSDIENQPTQEQIERAQQDALSALEAARTIDTANQYAQELNDIAVQINSCPNESDALHVRLCYTNAKAKADEIRVEILSKKHEQ